MSHVQNTGGEEMTISDDGIIFIQSWETLSLVAYPDGYGYPTIGWGHLIKKGEDFSDGITEEDADNIFLSDLAWAERTVNRVKTNLTQQQYDALVSPVFNIGETNFRKSTLLKLLNIPGDQDEDEQFKVWRKSGGRVSRGLEKRRRQEMNIYNNGVYEFTH